MWQSQISCQTFICLFQPRPLWNWIMETRYLPKELGLSYVSFLTVPLYIQWHQFIIFQFALPIPFHQVTSNFMLYLKMLYLNLLNIVIFLTLKFIPAYHPTRIKTISTIFKYKLSKSTLTETVILLSQLHVHFQNKISLRLFIIILVVSLLTD